MVVTPGCEIFVEAAVGQHFVGLDGISWPVISNHLWMQAWSMVSPSDEVLLFHANIIGHAAGYLLSDGSINVAEHHDGAPAELLHNTDNLDPGVIQIGKWLVGPLNNNQYFVISHHDQSPSDPPPFMLRYDGHLFTNGSKTSNAPPPPSYILDVHDDNSDTLTDWVYGEHTATGCFVLQRAVASAPTLVGNRKRRRNEMRI